MEPWTLGHRALPSERPTRLDRVVSLAPSITGNLLGMGLLGSLSGVSDECVDLFEAELEVGPALALGSYRDLDEGVLAALNPDLVIGDARVNRAENVTAIARQGFPIALARVDDLDATRIFLEELGVLFPRSGREAFAASSLLASPVIDSVADGEDRVEVVVLDPWHAGQSLPELCYPADLLRRVGALTIHWEGSLPIGEFQARYPRARILWPRPSPTDLPSGLAKSSAVIEVSWQSLFGFGFGTASAIKELKARLSE